MVTIKEHELPSKNGIEGLLGKADTIGAYTVASDKRGVGYIFATGEIAIVTAHGYIRMDLESAKRLVSELSGIIEDVGDLKRMGVKI